jgi:hypothetical protein
VNITDESISTTDDDLLQAAEGSSNSRSSRNDYPVSRGKLVRFLNKLHEWYQTSGKKGYLPSINIDRTTEEELT